VISIGDSVKVINPNSSFCGEIGVVKTVALSTAWVVLDAGDQKMVELQFYIHELEKVLV